MKTYSRFIGVMLLLVVAMVAAPPPVHSAQQPVEIKWLQWWVTEWGKDIHGELIANFEKTHPNIKVKVIDLPWTDMKTKVQAAAAANEDYDIFGTERIWLSSLVKFGYAEDLTPWLKNDPELASWLTDITPMVYQGKPRAMCLYIMPYAFTYNVDTFNAKGLKVPTNWDEFVQAMTALKDESKNQYGIAFPFQDNTFIISRDFGLRLAQEGGRWLDEKGNVAFNSPEGVRALQWWVDFYKKGLQVPGSFGQDQAFTIETMAMGQVPSTIDGPFIWIKTLQKNPKIKLAYAPVWKAAASGYNWSCSGIGLRAGSQHKKEAWEFIRYLYSSQTSVEMTKKVSLVWATKAAVDSLKTLDNPVLSQIPSYLNTDPKHNIILDPLPEGTKLIDAFGQAFQQALLGQKTPKAALDEAAKVWQEELDRARRQ